MIRKVAVANAILLVQYAVGSLVPLLLLPHIVRVIGLAEYGRLAVLLAWAGYGVAIVQYAFQLTGPKRVAQLAPGESVAGVFWDITSAKMLLLLLVGALMGVAVLILKPDASASSVAWLILIVLPMATCFDSTWFLQTQDRFLHICLFAIVGTLATLAIGFSCIRSESAHAIDFAVLVLVLGRVFVGVGTFMLATISVWRMPWRPSVAQAVESLRDGWHLFVSQFMAVLYSVSGPIVVCWLADAKAAGAYSVTERVMTALISAALLTHTAAYPRLAAAYANDRTGYRRLVKLVLAGYLGVTTTIAALVLALQEPVAQFLYGESGGQENGLLFFGIIWLILGIFGPVLTGYLTVSDHGREVWPLTLKILMVSLALGIPGVWLFGGVGWMAALVLGQSVVLYTGLICWRKEHGV